MTASEKFSEYLAGKFKDLHRDDLAILEYSSKNVQNLIDFNSRLSIRLYILVDTLVSKGILKEEEIDKLMSDQHVDRILKEIDENGKI